MSVEASVVVPTYRRNELLRRCLNDPATESLVHEYDHAAPVRLRYVKAGPGHGAAAARNCGWRAARGRVIAFTDDDCLPEPTWLAHGVQALVESGAAAATGRVSVPLPPRPTDYERDCAGLATAEFVTANCFCTREALLRIGGLDERFTAAWREDSDLQFMLLGHGLRIVSAPAAVVIHPVRPAPWGICLRQQWKAQFNVLLYKKHPTLYREHIPPMPRSYAASGIALGAAGVGAAAGSALLSLAAGGCWLALAMLLCSRRLRGTSKAPSHVAEMAITSAAIPLLSLYWRAIGILRYRDVAPHS
ncbi:MAG: glycosyl transferase family 2 [Planctomycetota bacterium]|nr:MAG: glycosyl transferase family 2 [Planctomycetota bacterium]